MNPKKLNSHIINLTEAEFISFLYSERDRENNLNQYHGWNNWVLIGALISTICVLYATCKNNEDISIGLIFYFVSGLVAAGFAYKSIFDVFRKERGYDFNRVKFLKDVVPWVDIASVLVASLVLSLWSYSEFERVTHIFIVWCCVFVFYSVLLIFEILSRDDLTPVNLNSALFPKLYQNIIINGFFGAFWGVLFQHSFNMAGNALLSIEFEIAAYSVAIYYLLYFIIKINFSNKVVNEFDLIIDRYLYQGMSQENTFNMILMNRMGYGVLEACYKELKHILQMLDKAEEDKKEIIKIKESILNNQYDLTCLPSYQRLLQTSLSNLRKVLSDSQKLSDKLDEFVKVSDGINRDDVEKLFKTNEIAYFSVERVCDQVDELRLLIETEIDKYYCNRIGILCKNGCHCRNDKRSWKDTIKFQLNRICKTEVLGRDNTPYNKRL